MKIRHASQVITVAIVLFSTLAICCLLLARHSWTVAQGAYDTCRVMLADADRLAAGSDRLTGAVRAYAATGDRRYYDDFQRELHVDRNRDRALEQLRRAGLSDDEQELVTRAKSNSDRLVGLENQAFAAVGRGDVTQAIRIVYGTEYAAAKTSIMEPIAEFRRRLERRLTENASALASRAIVFDNIALVMLLLNALSVLAALVLFYRRRVVDPLGRIARSLDELIARKEGASIGYQHDTSEIGDVARSIEKYRLAVAEADRQRWVKTSLAEIADHLLGTEQSMDFGRPLLASLVPLLGGGCGAFHLFDQRDGRFHFAGGYGLAPSNKVGSFAPGEGVAGQAAADRQPIYLSELPGDYMRIGSSLGNATPRSLAAVPIVSEEAVLAVLEIASLSVMTPERKALLGEVAEMAAVKIDALQRNAELRHINFLADSALELTRAGYWHVPLDGSGWYNSSERAARIFGDLPSPDHRYRLDDWTQNVFAGDEAAAKVTMENFNAAVAGSAPAYDATYAYKRPVDGRIVWIHALGHVVKDANGKPADMYGVTQDITEFKRLEMALISAARAEAEVARHRSVAQMVAGVAHELNTPLGIINTAADLMMQRLSHGEIVAEDLLEAGNLIARNVSRAHKLVQDFKKVSVNQITDVRENVRLPDVVEETAGLFKVTARQSRMEVSIINNLPAGRGDWTGYAGSLSQVLLNLLSNAQRYAYAEGVGGKVEITLTAEGDGAYCIAVRDFGNGIAPENLPRIFDPFFTTGRGKGGSGLGMSIVYNIVTVHLHGTISVDSKAGEGTTVTIRVPAVVPEG